MSLYITFGKLHELITPKVPVNTASYDFIELYVHLGIMIDPDFWLEASAFCE